MVFWFAEGHGELTLWEYV